MPSSVGVGRTDWGLAPTPRKKDPEPAFRSVLSLPRARTSIFSFSFDRHPLVQYPDHRPSMCPVLASPEREELVLADLPGTLPPPLPRLHPSRCFLARWPNQEL